MQCSFNFPLESSFDSSQWQFFCKLWLKGVRTKPWKVSTQHHSSGICKHFVQLLCQDTSIKCSTQWRCSLNGSRNIKRIFLRQILKENRKYYAFKRHFYVWKVKTNHVHSQTLSSICFILTLLTSMASGQQLLILIKDCFFSRYICLVSEPRWGKKRRKKHAHWSSHHSPTRCGRAGKRPLLQGYSTTKHFYSMFSSANTKEFLFTCQHDYSVQCFPLNAKRWSYFPTWELWEVLRLETKEAYNPAWITSCLWSLKWPVSLSLPTLKNQARRAREWGRKRRKSRK